MICLSKNKKDRYVNYFARGSLLKVEDVNYPVETLEQGPILFRGMTRKSLVEKCIENNIDFYYMDGGYFGNNPNPLNPLGWKYWHRIVKNDLQHTEIIDRPDDRLQSQRIKVHNWRYKDNKNILLVTPSEKPCIYYGIDVEQWKKDTVAAIRKYTDRPIVIRDKAPRENRLKRSIYYDLQNAHAVVTFQSIAACESVLYGIPVFTLAPTAADVVGNKNLSQIETPEDYDYDLRYKWACHLAYSQFHVEELRNGDAYRMLMYV